MQPRMTSLLCLKIGALSVIPAKRGGANWEIQGYRVQMRVEFSRASSTDGERW